jgi:hypothetical protein
MPQPLSVICNSFNPPSLTRISSDVEPASTAFSISSFRACTGATIISPAAILLTTFGSSAWKRRGQFQAVSAEGRLPSLHTACRGGLVLTLILRAGRGSSAVLSAFLLSPGRGSSAIAESDIAPKSPDDQTQPQFSHALWAALPCKCRGFPGTERRQYL